MRAQVRARSSSARRVLERGVRDGWLVKYGRDSYKRATFNGREQARAERARPRHGTRKLDEFDTEAGRA